MIVYFIGIYLVYYGAARYHFPITPWATMYSAALVSAFIVGDKDESRVIVMEERKYDAELK